MLSSSPSLCPWRGARNIPDSSACHVRHLRAPSAAPASSRASCLGPAARPWALAALLPAPGTSPSPPAPTAPRLRPAGKGSRALGLGLLCPQLCPQHLAQSSARSRCPVDTGGVKERGVDEGISTGPGFVLGKAEPVSEAGKGARPILFSLRKDSSVASLSGAMGELRALRKLSGGGWEQAARVCRADGSLVPLLPAPEPLGHREGSFPFLWPTPAWQMTATRQTTQNG